MKFVMSYSMGKDSTLALHKMIEAGNECVGLLVMINEEANRSFFHGASREMLLRCSASLGIGLIECPSKGENYHLEFEKGLKKAKAMGATLACFGDIDLEGNRAWGEERCKNTDIKSAYPLWQRDRSENVYEVTGLGYKCIVKSINNTLLPESLLGKALNAEAAETMKECGIDICGENGEYHTLTMDGPIFKTPLEYETGEIIRLGDYSVVDIK